MIIKCLLLYLLNLMNYIRIFFTFEEIIFYQSVALLERKTYLCNVRSEKWLGDKKAFFCFILNSKSPISHRKDRDNGNAHSVYMCIRYSWCYACVYHTVWEYCFFVHFLWGVWRCLNSESRTSLTLSFCIYLNCSSADFGDLQATNVV